MMDSEQAEQERAEQAEREARIEAAIEHIIEEAAAYGWTVTVTRELDGWRVVIHRTVIVPR